MKLNLMVMFYFYNKRFLAVDMQIVFLLPIMNALLSKSSLFLSIRLFNKFHIKKGPTTLASPKNKGM